MRKQSITLIGMPGSGKSTVGVVLAKVLGMSFIDMDLFIQQCSGMLLQEIINTRGIDAFMKIEEEVAVGINCPGCVIATGGSVVYSSRASKHLGSLGPVVYLELSCDEIEKRINNMATRGIAMKNGQTLKDLYTERIPLYEKYAHISIKCDGKSLQDIVAEIVYAVGVYRD